MSVKKISTEFEWMIKNMVKTCGITQENIECELMTLMRVTVNSCATMYGFSAEEALNRLDPTGNIIEIVATKEKKQQVPKASKEEKQLLKEKKETEKANES